LISQIVLLGSKTLKHDKIFVLVNMLFAVTLTNRNMFVGVQELNITRTADTIFKE
jgi:hypothetical protein